MHVGTVSDLSDEKIVEKSLFPLELPPGKTVTGDKSRDPGPVRTSVECGARKTCR
jgi:hypothetical protein